MNNKRSNEALEQFHVKKTNREIKEVWGQAHDSAIKGKRLASRVIKMIESGKTESIYRTGPSNHHSWFGYLPTDYDSVRLATNAELKEKNIDMVADIKYDDSKQLLVIEEINRVIPNTLDKDLSKQ